MAKLLVNIIHYGSAILLLTAGVLATMHIELPGITVNPDVAITAGAGVLAAGWKGGLT